MKTIGEILKEARINKSFSVNDVEKVTKIRSSFITAIENGKWEELPTFPTVLGFVKSISWALGVEEKLAVAILKRDYPPKNLKITPKPDIGGKFIWSPKLTFALGIIIAAVILFGYLGLEYFRFVSPPRLFVESPKDSQTIIGNSVNVFGSTDGDAKVTINGQPVIVSDDGKFSVSLDVVPETSEITIVASSRSGKVTTESRRINVRAGD